MFYKALGYTVWNGGKWYMSRRAPGSGTSQKLVAASVLALALGSAVALGAKRAS